MRTDFDLKKIMIEPCGDDYAFVAGKYVDEDGNDCYLRVDVPMKSDPNGIFGCCWLCRDCQLGYDAV